MDIQNRILRSDFHDSSLFRCFSDESALYLFIRNINIDLELEEYYTATVKLTNARSMKRNGTAISEFKLETSTCEVLQLSFVEGHGSLLVEWHTFRPANCTFAKYDFDYDTVELAIEKQDDLIL